METEQANEAKTTVPDAQPPPTTDTQGTQPTDSETQSSNSDTSLPSQEKPPEDVTESDTMDSTAPQPPPPPPPTDSVSDHTVTLFGIAYACKFALVLIGRCPWIPVRCM